MLVITLARVYIQYAANQGNAGERPDACRGFIRYGDGRLKGLSVSVYLYVHTGKTPAVKLRGSGGSAPVLMSFFTGHFVKLFLCFLRDIF